MEAMGTNMLGRGRVFFFQLDRNKVTNCAYSPKNVLSNKEYLKLK